MAKVLLVDDDALVRRVVRVVLEADGHEVLEAGGGGAAVRLVDSQQPEVVVLDLMMPGENGMETCRRIKLSDVKPKVLVLSGLPEGAAEARSAGADDHMVKPFSSLELIRRVAALAESR